jgi:2-keto-3-deoxy-L-rhamnonate aldolase RhmA
MHESVAAIASCGVSPIVRIPDNQGWMVKRALDSGAHGIVVPLLYTADDARKLVQSAKFPPVGQRGYGSPFSMGMFDVQGGMSGLQYLQQANEGLVTIVQIETREAFENVRICRCLVQLAAEWCEAANMCVSINRSMRLRKWMGLTSCSSGRGISAIILGIR